MKNKSLFKVDLLGVLSKAKEVSADDLAGLLVEGGFRDGGSNADADAARLEAGGWLTRLYRQGLVGRREGQRTLQYPIPGREEPVERRQRVVLWEITEKGLGRLKWLREQGPPSVPGLRTGKRPKSRSR